MTSLYDMLYHIDNYFEGIQFDKIEGISIIGSPRSGGDEHPIQYFARTKVRNGEDDPFEGVGWTPSEAVRNLLKELNAPDNRDEDNFDENYLFN